MWSAQPSVGFVACSAAFSSARAVKANKTVPAISKSDAARVLFMIFLLVIGNII
jgi:hypothetical protein